MNGTLWNFIHWTNVKIPVSMYYTVDMGHTFEVLQLEEGFI